MLKQPIQQALEFVGRQLAFLATRPDFRLQSALDRIAANGDDSIRTAVNAIKTNQGALTNSGYGSLFKIIAAVKSHGATGDIIVTYNGYRHQIDQEINAHLLSLRSSFTYFAALLLIAFVVFAIFKTSVAGNLYAVFLEFEHELPQLTAFMLGPGALWGLGALTMTGIALGSLSLALYRLYVDLSGFRYCNVSPAWLWGGRRILSITNTYILLAYIDLLMRGGMSADEAATHAYRLAGCRQPEAGAGGMPAATDRLLSYAKKNDTFSAELAYHLHQAPTQLITALTEFRTSFTVFLQAFLFVLIGGLIIAYYLPIFALGAMV